MFFAVGFRLRYDLRPGVLPIQTLATYKLEQVGVENDKYVVKYLSIIDNTSWGPSGTVPETSSEVVSIMLQPLANASVSPRLPRP